ncbi:hypothetical protein N0V90_001439 [Kalmusia sp. IMI 367209]|nr:hypothetical protein N0V90_001439 [Kalmusia sp. IMI 367209]
MIVAGQTIYVATSADDIGGVWKNTKTISLNPLSMDMYTWVGISKQSCKAMFDPHPGAKYNAGYSKPLTPTQMVIELHHQQESGARLDELFEKKTIPAMFTQMTDFQTNPSAMISRSEKSVVVSLYQLCVDLFVTQPTEMFWGPELLKYTPDLIQAFLSWEYTSWKFMFQLPSIFARDMLAAKSTITGAFTNYYGKPRTERSDSVFFVAALEDMLREVGLSEDEMGKFTMLHYWA